MTILVTGANGLVGRHVVDGLLKTGHRVRALSRQPSETNLSVDTRKGDLEDPPSLAEALTGIESMYLFPVAETAADVVAMAKHAGVRRIVVLSGTTADEDDRGGYREVEKAVEDSGLEWTHVRASEFAGNWRDFAPTIRAERVVRRPYGQAVTQPTHEADIAAVAVAALTEDHHVGKIYPLAGPEGLTVVQQVAAIAAALNENIRFEEQDPAQARKLWVRDGYPAEFVDWLFALWADSTETPTNQEWASVVPKVTGRPGRTFAQWAIDHADGFR